MLMVGSGFVKLARPIWPRVVLPSALMFTFAACTSVSAGSSTSVRLPWFRISTSTKMKCCEVSGSVTCEGFMLIEGTARRISARSARSSSAWAFLVERNLQKRTRAQTPPTRMATINARDCTPAARSLNSCAVIFSPTQTQRRFSAGAVFAIR